MIGSLIASPALLVSTTLTRIKRNHTESHCTEIWTNEYNGQAYTITIFVATFILPVVVLLFVYSRIKHRVVQNITPGNPDSFRDKQQRYRNNKVYDEQLCYKLMSVKLYIYI